MIPLPNFLRPSTSPRRRADLNAPGGLRGNKGRPALGLGRAGAKGGGATGLGDLPGAKGGRAAGLSGLSGLTDAMSGWIAGLSNRTGPAPEQHADGPAGHDAKRPRRLSLPFPRPLRSSRPLGSPHPVGGSSHPVGSSRPSGSSRPLRDWAELLRVSAPASVPGDLLAGAAAAGLRPNTRTALATLSSVCLYEAGMALNDWADRDIDALERPYRPIPSGRIAPGAALAAAGGLTAAGLACAAAAGRPALVTATALAATVWAYDLHLKNTPAGPAAMACARTLDLLQGAIATNDPTSSARPAALHALPSAALLGAHTLTITTVSRREAQGSASSLPLLSLAAITALAHTTATRPLFRRSTPQSPPAPSAQAAATPAAPVTTAGPAVLTTSAALSATGPTPTVVMTRFLAAGYAATAARPLLLAALNPSPHFLQRAVGGGIRAMIPLQAALAARAGAPATGAAVLAFIPVARRLSRKVSPT